MRLEICSLVLVLSALSLSCGDDSDSGGSNGTGNEESANELSLEEYLREIEAVVERAQDLESIERPDIPESASFEDGKQVILNYVSEYQTIVAEAADDVQGLDPPDEAQGPHDAFVRAVSVVEEEINTFVKEIEIAETASEILASANAFNERIPEALQETIPPCDDLQNLADNSNIVVDLRCDG